LLHKGFEFTLILGTESREPAN